MAYEDLALDVIQIHRLLRAPSQAHNHVTNNVRHLSIEGRNCSEEDKDYETGFDKSVSYHMRRLSLCRLFKSLISRMSELKSLHVSIIMKETGLLEFWMIIEEEEWMRNMADFLSIVPKSLTSLTIDNPGYPEESNIAFYTRGHLCPVLLDPEVLPSLRHLRIRLCNICSKMFGFAKSVRHTRLQTLIINLSLYEDEVRCLQNSTPCLLSLTAASDDGTLYVESEELAKAALVYKMREAAEVALAYLPSLTVLRLLYHQLPDPRLISYDIISEKKVIFPKDASWTDLHCIGEEEMGIENNQHPDVDLIEDLPSNTASTLDEEA